MLAPFLPIDSTNKSNQSNDPGSPVSILLLSTLDKKKKKFNLAIRLETWNFVLFDSCEKIDAR